uniref:Uncharacterized protein n=1 Tax=Kuetzingia canaliculata TaxID=228262 RepID=A0A1Z1MPU0_KUECA|nr:hypothetical protein [Kuetzingia canaliculata]ARW67781.1 hypothetical protein [Kuetzingia canaliculata]
MTIKYWPNQRSINLNNHTVDLFFSIENKLQYELSNRSNSYLCIDILNNLNKYKIFYITLIELKQLILELTELNLSHQDLKDLKQRILTIFTERVYNHFNTSINFLNQSKKKLLVTENETLIEHLLTYLLFGSSYITKNIFLFDPVYTPYYHVQILFENFIIIISNTIIENLLNQLKSYSKINYFLQTRDICNKSYLSNRSIALFLNNLKLQKFFSIYLYEPKSIYNERQQIWLISPYGIKTKYIYRKRSDKIKEFNQLKILFLFWLEIKDIVIPKIEKFLIQIGKYIIFFSINLLSNMILVGIRIMIFYISKSTYNKKIK